MIAVYAWLKLDVLINQKDTNILSTTNQLAYADDEIFSYDNGLNIAVAFTAYDNEEEWILDERYGELFFAEYSWGDNSDGSYYLNRERLES